MTATPFLSKGAKIMYYPQKNRGTAYRGTTDSTTFSIAQISAKSKEKTKTQKPPLWPVTVSKSIMKL